MGGRARWEALRNGRACPICERGGPPPDTIAELGVSWVTSGLGPLPVRGYACVVAKRHVVEPYELEGDERAAFWEDVLVAAEALEHLGKPLAASDHADTKISLALGHRVGVLPIQSCTYWFSRMPSPRTDWSVSTLFVLSAAPITGRSVSDHCAFFITQYSF